jgi:hypothetical protein
MVAVKEPSTLAQNDLKTVLLRLFDGYFNFEKLDLLHIRIKSQIVLKITKFVGKLAMERQEHLRSYVIFALLSWDRLRHLPSEPIPIFKALFNQYLSTDIDRYDQSFSIPHRSCPDKKRNSSLDPFFSILFSLVERVDIPIKPTHILVLFISSK